MHLDPLVEQLIGQARFAGGEAPISAAVRRRAAISRSSEAMVSGSRTVARILDNPEAAKSAPGSSEGAERAVGQAAFGVSSGRRGNLAVVRMKTEKGGA